MKKILTILIIAIMGTNLSSCAQMTKQDVGTVSGGVIGGLLGSQFGGGTGKLVAIGVGTLAGAYLGGSIGKSMDDVDRMRVCRALEGNAIGQPAYWTNERTGANYTVIPTRNVTVEGNPYCREYRTTAVIAGKKQQIFGTACRQPDGTWQIEN